MAGGLCGELDDVFAEVGLDDRAERIAQGLEDALAAEEARENAEREKEKLLAQARTVVTVLLARMACHF